MTLPNYHDQRPTMACRIALTALGVAKGHDVDDALDLALFVTPSSAVPPPLDELVHMYLTALEGR